MESQSFQDPIQSSEETFLSEAISGSIWSAALTPNLMSRGELVQPSWEQLSFVTKHSSLLPAASALEQV